MKELLTRKTAALTLGLGLALGNTACAAPWDRDHQDPNQLAACDVSWYGSAPNVTDKLTAAHEAMQAGRSELIAEIHENTGDSDSGVRLSMVPAQLKAAADILIRKTNPYWYDTSQLKLATPREEFCTNPTNNTEVFETPEYVEAVAALQVAGIHVGSKH